jgi:glucose-6-phosphate isomerase
MMDKGSLNFFLGADESAVLDTLGIAKEQKIIERIWAGDFTVWKSEPDSIANRLGWLFAPEETLQGITSIRSIIDPLIGSISDVVVLGMGGSGLAAGVFNSMLGGSDGAPRLHLLDTTDPGLIGRVTKSLDVRKTLLLVSSKSGNTLETISLFRYFYNFMLAQIGRDAGRHFLVITDEGSPLVRTARELSLQHVFLSNQDIGGRYSALSLTGIIPALIIGVDAERLLQKAIAAAGKETAPFFSGELAGGGAVLGAVLGTLAKKGRNKLTFIFPPSWKPFGSWLEQLIAESTGKEGSGILPVPGESSDAAGKYGKDRVFVIFEDEKNKFPQVISALSAAAHPLITITVCDPYDLGAQMFLWEMAAAVAGYVLGINPFDQPDVEATKAHTRRMIARIREQKELPQEIPDLTTSECDVYGGGSGDSAAEVLNSFLCSATAIDYVCLQVYLSPGPEMDEALRQLRAVIFARSGLPVTMGYGPCYLHSTGQLHKGDAGHGLFIQLTAPDEQDIEIPDEPGLSGSSLTFGTLKRLQAAADRQALTELCRIVIRLHFKKDIIANVKALAVAIAGSD